MPTIRNGSRSNPDERIEEECQQRQRPAEHQQNAPEQEFHHIRNTGGGRISCNSTGYVTHHQPPTEGRSQQQPVLRRDAGGNRLRPDAIALLCQAHRPDDVDCDGAVDPARQPAGIAQHRDRGSTAARRPAHARRGAIQNPIGERAAGMARHDDVGSRVFRRHPDRAATNAMRPASLGHAVHEHVVKLAGSKAGNVLSIDERIRRRIVEQQHDLREQAVPAAQVEHASAAEQPPHAARHLPRLVQLLARQTSGLADRARQAIEKRVVRKPIDVVVCESRCEAGENIQLPLTTLPPTGYHLPPSRSALSASRPCTAPRTGWCRSPRRFRGLRCDRRLARR